VVSTTILFQCPTEIATTFCIVEEEEEEGDKPLQTPSRIKCPPLAKTSRV
jgi:hypothetical protein